MFIEFGRLGCKHIIYLGAGYVHLNCVHTHLTFWLKHCKCLCLLLEFRKLFDSQAEVTSLVRPNQPEGTGLVG